MPRNISRASSYLPQDKRYLGDSGSSRSSPATMNDGAAQISRKIRQELYVNAELVIPMSLGMINHARPISSNHCYSLSVFHRFEKKNIPATKRFPRVQNAAMKDNIEPRFDFGWNSAKYDQITGPLPPRLKPAYICVLAGL